MSVFYVSNVEEYLGRRSLARLLREHRDAPFDGRAFIRSVRVGDSADAGIRPPFGARVDAPDECVLGELNA